MEECPVVAYRPLLLQLYCMLRIVERIDITVAFDRGTPVAEQGDVAVEARPVGAVTACFKEAPEDSSLRSFLPSRSPL